MCSIARRTSVSRSSFQKGSAFFVLDPSPSVPFSLPSFHVASFSAGVESLKEDQIAEKLRDVVAATHVEVEDISGGCGSMYKVLVVSPEFEGLGLVKQHRLVQKAIASEIADMHGLTLKTISEKKWQKSKS